MKRLICIWVFLFLLAAVRLPDAASGIDPSRCSKFPALVSAVTDGDTIVADIDLGFSVVMSKSKVRLWGINTPESRTKNPLEKAAGIAAKTRLSELVMGVDGVELCIDRRKPRGKFGRILAIVFVNDLNVNQTLLDEGHATPYFGGKREPWAPPPAESPAIRGLGIVEFLYLNHLA